jgi:hypothetical protein
MGWLLKIKRLNSFFAKWALHAGTLFIPFLLYKLFKLIPKIWVTFGGWRLIYFVLKWGFHFCTGFIPLLLYLIFNLIFKTSYNQKLRNIEGIGDETADLIISNFPNEESLKNASLKEIQSIHGIGIGTASRLKDQFFKIIE